MARQPEAEPGAGEDDRAEGVEGVQRAVGGAADVRVAAGHLEFAARAGGDPELAALIQIERARNPLECVRILVEIDPAVVAFEADRRGVAAPFPASAERVAQAAAAGRV